MSEERRGQTLEEERPPEMEKERPPGPRLAPILYPLAAVAGGGLLVWAFSRILLALDVDFAVAVATLGAINILIGAALVAYGARIRGRPASWPLLAGAGLAVVAVGFVAMAVWGDRGPEMLEEERERERAATERVTLVAKDIAFDRTELTLAAGARVEVTLDNQDAGIEHSFALYTDESAQEPIFVGDIFAGVDARTYPAFTAPPAGTYFFRCDVHPQQMTGTVTVAEGPAEGAGEPGGPVTVRASGIAFDTQTITVAPGQVRLDFVNDDANIPHNISVYRTDAATAEERLFEGEIFNGVATRTYEFEAPPPGRYFFRCDVHPQQMTGTFVVSGG